MNREQLSGVGSVRLAISAVSSYKQSEGRSVFELRSEAAVSETLSPTRYDIAIDLLELCGAMLQIKAVNDKLASRHTRLIARAWILEILENASGQILCIFRFRKKSRDTVPNGLWNSSMIGGHNGQFGRLSFKKNHA